MAVTKTCRCGRQFCVILHYQCNYSYFEAPKGGWHSSDWSSVLCLKCGHHWRSRAAWIEKLHVLKHKEIQVWAKKGHEGLYRKLKKDGTMRE